MILTYETHKMSIKYKLFTVLMCLNIQASIIHAAAAPRLESSEWPYKGERRWVNLSQSTEALSRESLEKDYYNTISRCYTLKQTLDDQERASNPSLPKQPIIRNFCLPIFSFRIEPLENSTLLFLLLNGSVVFTTTDVWKGFGRLFLTEHE